MWKSNIDPYASDEPDEWCSYSEEECQIIEEALRNGESYARLKNYYIDFEKCLQISKINQTKRRPVKRVEHHKGKQT